MGLEATIIHHASETPLLNYQEPSIKYAQNLLPQDQGLPKWSHVGL